MEKLKDIEKVQGTGIPGLTSKLIKRGENACIYLRSDGYYEVFKIKVQSRGEVFGKFYPERELYPSNEEFGNTAFCCKQLNRAEKRYNVLNTSN